MGAPKQKWTSEEEGALKAGVRKYGVGKWSTILKDPEFHAVLRSRSNVDLKDKWRNLNCMTNGSGSRHRASSSHRSTQWVQKDDEDATSHATMVEKDSVDLDASPRAATNETIHDASSGKKFSRMDDLILEAITKLKEPRGSSRLTIAEYIEDHHSAPPDLERNLAARLKLLTEKGRLIKVKRQYRIAPRSISVNVINKDLPENGIVILTKAQIDAEIEKMKSMSAPEAAEAAARAVAEAEAAIAAAEAAALEADEAEAEAEAARCFADAAQKALHRDIIRV